MDLQDIEIEEVLDNDCKIRGDPTTFTEFLFGLVLENGFIVRSPKKSFIVYAATRDEREQWMRHIKNCIAQCGKKSNLCINKY